MSLKKPKLIICIELDLSKFLCEMDDSETSTLQSAVIETRKQSQSFFNLVSQPGSQVLFYPLSHAIGTGRRGPWRQGHLVSLYEGLFRE